MTDDAYDDRKYGTEPLDWEEDDLPEMLSESDDSWAAQVLFTVPLFFLMGALCAIFVWPGRPATPKPVGNRSCFYFVQHNNSYERITPTGASYGQCI
jgi:hypothetical protein